MKIGTVQVLSMLFSLGYVIFHFEGKLALSECRIVGLKNNANIVNVNECR
jgi:hypothetical protein